MATSPSTSTLLALLDRFPRRILALTAAVCVGMLAFGLYLQHAVGLEPCPMCAGAIVQARIPRVIYGTTDPKAGACETLYNITCDSRLNHQAYVAGGVMAQECAQLLKDFFAVQRAMGKK